MLLRRSVGTGRRAGAVIAWLVVCLGVIVAIVALGMDGGRLMEERRAVQAAADAAAFAAGNDLYANFQQNQGTDPNGTARAAALASAVSHGYANDGSRSVVTVNIPPLSGVFKGKTACAEVVIQSNLSGTFSAIFTRDASCVRARTVARGRPQNIGLILLQPTGTGLNVSGNASVQVVNAPIVSNSPSSQVYSLSGTGSVSASYHDVAAASLAQTTQIVGPINTNVPAAADPLRPLAPPNAAAYPTAATSTFVPATTAITAATDIVAATGNPVAATACGCCGCCGTQLQPGVYNGGIVVSGNSAVTLAPGVYVCNGGGFQISGNASVTGDQVLIYNTGGASAGPINVSGNAAIQLSAPTSGSYQGICIYQDQGLGQTLSLSGNGSCQITGMVYAPSATVQISGNSNVSGNTMGGGYIVNSLQVSGNATVTINHGNNLPRVPQIGLIE